MEPAQSDLRNLFLIFLQVFQYCQGFYKDPDIYILFKSAKLLEDTYLKLESIGSTRDFENKLNEFWVSKGLKAIPLKFFKNISHEVLSKLITGSDFSNEEVKSAIRQFLIFYSDQDLYKVIKKIYYTNRSVQILKQISENGSGYNAVTSLEVLSMCLSSNKGNVEETNSIVTAIASSDENNFKTVLRLLCDCSGCEPLPDVEGVIELVASLLKSPDHVHLYTCVLELSEAELCSVVTSWDSLADSFINMLEYSISRLKCNYSGVSYVWLSTELKVLTFEEITALINKLKVAPNVCNRLKELFNRLSQEDYVIVSEDLLRICKLKY